MTADAFLRAILAAPQDDGPRLVYADWLDEQGEADRAAFIRVQCQLARLEEHGPRRVDLEARERALLERHEAAWLGELPPAARAWSFRRGFPDRLALTTEAGTGGWRLPPTVTTLALDMEYVSGLGQPSNAAALLTADHPARLAGRELTELWPTGDWEAAPLLERLTRLTLDQVSVADPDWQARLRPGRLAGVTDLALVGPLLTAEGLAALARPAWADRWTGLTWLPAAEGQATPAVLDYLSACGDLRRLHLPLWPARSPAVWRHLTNLTVEAPATLTDLGRLRDSRLLPQLRRLGLTVEGLRRGGLLEPLREVLGGLARPALRLRLVRIEQPDVSQLLRDGRCRRWLTALDLDGLASPTLLHALADGPLWDALTDLALTVSRGPSAEALTELLRAPALARLRRLHLTCHRFSAAAAGALAGSSYLDLLRDLHLTATQFGPGALATLAAWPGLGRLDRLHLTVGARAGFDLHYLADAPALSPLTELHLGWPRADEDREPLAALRARLGRRLHA
jgi:uncharacterized protein (TIGR02996 family)